MNEIVKLSKTKDKKVYSKKKNLNFENLEFDQDSRRKHLKYGENIIKTKLITNEEKINELQTNNKNHFQGRKK